MARYNEILVARFNRALTRHLGIKGEAPAPQVAGEIQPMLPMFGAVGDRLFEGWDRFGVTVTVLAVAAKVNVLRLRNPVGSGVMALIEYASLSASTGSNIGAFGVIVPGVDLTNVFASVRLDVRGKTNAALIVTQDTLAAGTASLFLEGDLLNGTVFAFTPSDSEGWLPLPPGMAFDVQSAVVNLGTRHNIIWRERPLEDSELKI